MVKVRIVQAGNKTMLYAPYLPAMLIKAKALGGHWDGSSRAWVFDGRDEERVRELARSLYGTDGETPVELVTVHLTVTGPTGGNLFALGREIAFRAGRDVMVTLGPGVILVDGELRSSGGSRATPKVLDYNQTVTFEVRDVPRPLVVESETVRIINPPEVQAPNPLASLSDEALVTELRRRGYEVICVDQEVPGVPNYETV